MDRITRKHLEPLVAEINRMTGSPDTPWSQDAEGHNRANIGNYHLSRAYGGYCLHRMHNEHGGVTTPLNYGHVPARQLHEALRAFITGYRTAQQHMAKSCATL